MSRRSNPAEELLRRTAHRETFRNLAHQLQCLKRRYNVLYGVTTDTASSSNQAEKVSPQQQQQPNSRAFILRKLKYALRTQYEACFPLPPPDRCTVLLLFDSNEEAFFEIRLKPKAWPVNWPTGLDWGSADGIEVELLSGAIYMKVLEALREERDGMSVEEPLRAFGVVSSSRRTGDRTGTRGLRSSVVEENRLTRVIVKSEEEEIVISDGEEEEENNVPANEQVNRRASADGHGNNGDQQQQEENGIDYNNMFQGEDLAERPRREGSSSIRSSSTANNHHNHNNNHNSNGSSSSQRPFSNTASVKPEPTANSSSSLINTRRRPLESTSTLRHSPLPPPPPPPSAAAAAARAPRTRASNRALPDASASASASAPTFYLLNSLCSPAEMTAAISRFTASSAYQSARAYHQLPCPLCEKQIAKYCLTDHLNAVHLRRRRYHCTWPGCAKAFFYRSDGGRHLRRAHQSRANERYLQVRE